MTRTGFRVFHRTWWKLNPRWPDGREPGAGRKRYIGRATTEAAAQAMCREWNATHAPGFLSDRAEYEKE